MPRERMKTCTRCGNAKPWSAFYAKAKWDDGTMRQPHSRCRECMNTEKITYWQAARDEINARRRERAARLRLQRTRERGGLLSIGPFRSWLVAELEKFDQDAVAFAGAIGTDDRTVRAWLRERKLIQVDTVDRAFCVYGEPRLLAELYPELYDFQEATS